MRPLCSVCGQIHGRCVAHKKHVTPKQPCNRWPRKGEDLCRGCGGNASQVRAAAERRKADEQARVMAQTLGGPIEGDPKEFLLQEIYWSAGHVAYYRSMVQALDPDALVRGTRGVSRTVGHSTGGPMAGDSESTTTEVGPLVHAWLERYDSERSRFAGLCATAVKIGIEERVVRSTERNSETFGLLLRAIIDDLHLSAEQLSRVPDVVGRHLQAISA